MKGNGRGGKNKNCERKLHKGCRKVVEPSTREDKSSYQYQESKIRNSTILQNTTSMKKEKRSQKLEEDNLVWQPGVTSTEKSSDEVRIARKIDDSAKGKGK